MHQNRGIELVTQPLPRPWLAENKTIRSILRVSRLFIFNSRRFVSFRSKIGSCGAYVFVTADVSRFVPRKQRRSRVRVFSPKSFWPPCLSRSSRLDNGIMPLRRRRRSRQLLCRLFVRVAQFTAESPTSFVSVTSPTRISGQ